MYIDDGYCNVHDKQCEMDDNCDKYEPNLTKAWETLILELDKAMGLSKILEWLNNRIIKICDFVNGLFTRV